MNNTNGRLPDAVATSFPAIVSDDLRQMGGTQFARVHRDDEGPGRQPHQLGAVPARVVQQPGPGSVEPRQPRQIDLLGAPERVRRRQGGDREPAREDQPVPLATHLQRSVRPGLSGAHRRGRAGRVAPRFCGP